MTLFASPRSRTQLAWIAVAAIWALLAAMACRAGLISDEWIHFNQVSRMRAGDWLGIDPSLTMLTGYHGLVAAAMKAVGAESLGAARWISALAGVLAAWCFRGLRRELAKDASALPVQQFAVLPILLPFVFLVYTDVLSIAMVLGAMWLALRNRHATAALVLLASLLVRQNNVVWAAFIAAWCLWPAMRWRPWRSWRESLRIGMPYAAVVAAFAGYWIVHGGISVSETQSYAHPDVSFHVGNAYFALAMLALLMPLHVGLGLRRFVAKAMARPAWWWLPLATLAVFACCFRVDHEYNRVVPDFNLRNAWLLAIDAHLVAKSLFGLVATLAACALAGNGTASGRGWLLLPFAAVALCAAWLIEPRYALVPIAFWLAMRRQESAPVEQATLALWGVLAVYLATGIFDYRFMI
jgi:alpha-1,2-glucosyltransferase